MTKHLLCEVPAPAVSARSLAGNPGANPISVLNTVLAGWLFGLMFFDPAGKPTVPSLGLITGFHIAWNYFLGFVLCLPVSGISVHWHWTTFEPANATWSGGQYGLEASLAFPFVGGALVIFQALRLRRLRAQRA